MADSVPASGGSICWARPVRLGLESAQVKMGSGEGCGPGAECLPCIMRPVGDIREGRERKGGREGDEEAGTRS